MQKGIPALDDTYKIDLSPPSIHLQYVSISLTCINLKLYAPFPPDTALTPHPYIRIYKLHLYDQAGEYLL